MTRLNNTPASRVIPFDSGTLTKTCGFFLFNASMHSQQCLYSQQALACLENKLNSSGNNTNGMAIVLHDNKSKRCPGGGETLRCSPNTFDAKP